MSDSVVEKKWIIYKITRFDGVSYIGMTRQPLHRRWTQHVSDACGQNKRKATCRYLANSIATYGKDAFTLETIGTANTLRTAQFLENMCIDLYGTLTPNGMNLRKGEINYNNDGAFISEDTREKLREAGRKQFESPEAREKMRERVKSYVYSLTAEERKEKYGTKSIGKASHNKGKKLNIDERRKISESMGAKPFLLEETGTVFINQQECADVLHVQSGSVGESLRKGGRITPLKFGQYNFKVRYLRENENANDVFEPTISKEEFETRLQFIAQTLEKYKMLFDTFTIESLNEKKNELGTWDNVAAHYNVSERFLSSLRRRLSKKQQPQEN